MTNPLSSLPLLTCAEADYPLICETDLPKASHVLDTCHLYCPEPIMLLHQAVRALDSQSILHVIATDPATQRDIPKFCTFLRYPLLHQGQDDQNQYHYLLSLTKQT
ncbi:sulfurtransferase TusA [Allopseudospirillum japonicum]|nr:sulfurtransferase TusA [Allopseudospirillum japonicum]